MWWLEKRDAAADGHPVANGRDVGVGGGADAGFARGRDTCG